MTRGTRNSEQSSGSKKPKSGTNPLGTDNVTNATLRQPTIAKKASVKHQQELADTTVVAEPLPAKKAKMNLKTKRQREEDDAVAVESEQAVGAKKSKTALTKSPTALQSPRQTGRKQTKSAKAPGPVKKRRTKEEVAADKAKKAAEKMALEELTKQKDLAMKRMDIREDIDRAKMATKTVRTFMDLDHNTASDAEEFVGYNEASSEDESDAISPTNLKVSFCIDLNS
jgi:hypothetical protein